MRVLIRPLACCIKWSSGLPPIKSRAINLPARKHGTPKTEQSPFGVPLFGCILIGGGRGGNNAASREWHVCSVCRQAFDEIMPQLVPVFLKLLQSPLSVLPLGMCVCVCVCVRVGGCTRACVLRVSSHPCSCGCCLTKFTCLHPCWLI